MADITKNAVKFGERANQHDEGVSIDTASELLNVGRASQGAMSQQRAVPTIKASAVQWQSEGFAWRTAMVRLPAGLTLQDLNDAPSIWVNVQKDPTKALRRFDAIRAVAFDEAWMVEAIVNHADADTVVLAGIRKVDLPKRNVALFEDGTYRVDWCGSGYGVIRKADNVLIGGQTYGTAEAAKAALLQQYSTRKVA